MAHGNGKVILFGEHAVVYGVPAIAASLDRGVTASAERAQANVLEIRPWGRTVRDDEGSGDPLVVGWRALLAARGPGAPPLHVVADVALPAGAGLGCSAALGVAIVRAFAEADGRVLADVDAAEASLPWECVFHGNPSGVDSAMAATRGIAEFRKGEPLRPIQAKTPLPLVVLDTGVLSATKGMVDAVLRQWEQDRARVEKVFEGIRVLVANAKLAIASGDLEGVGEFMNLNQTLLSSLLVSTAGIEGLVARLREEGALGAKLTGAGGGGCVIGLARTRPDAERIADRLRGEVRDAFVAEVG